MFESLAYDSSLQNESGVEQIISGTFMENSDHDLNFEENNYTYASGLSLRADSQVLVLIILQHVFYRSREIRDTVHAFPVMLQDTEDIIIIIIREL